MPRGARASQCAPNERADVHTNRGLRQALERKSCGQKTRHSRRTIIEYIAADKSIYGEINLVLFAQSTQSNSERLLHKFSAIRSFMCSVYSELFLKSSFLA